MKVDANMITPDVTIQCPTCCQRFAVPLELLLLRKERHETVICPLGHEIVWPNHEDKVQKLTNQIARLTANLDRVTNSEAYWLKCNHRLKHANAALRGYVSRLQRAAAKGKRS